MRYLTVIFFMSFFVQTSFSANDHLLLCEAVLTPTANEFIEISNPTNSTINLTNYYLSDDEDYALLPGAFGDGPAPDIEDFDFIVQFPPGTSIGPFQTLVIAIDGDGFSTAFGKNADFEILSTSAATPDMLATDVGASPGLTNSGESITIFTWDGTSDLVQDIDAVNLGTPSGSNDIGNKSGLSVDGPDADTTPSVYNNDAATMPLQTSDPGFGFSTKRIQLESGEINPGGNGLTGDDETSELITTTWDSIFTAPNPGICSSSQVIINEVDAEISGIDDLEFVELYGPPNTSLNGLSLVFYNGSDDASYEVFDLDGFSLDADGFFVLGNAAVTNVDRIFPDNILQNGSDAVALYLADATDFPNDTPVTAVNLIDALVYDTDDSDDSGLLSVLTPGQAQINERGGGDGTVHSNARTPDGGTVLNTTSYVQQKPTPGRTNLTYNIVTTQVVLNEVDTEMSGTDQLEFVELYGPANTALDGLSLVFYNGTGDSSYEAFDLDGFSLDADGFFVLGNAGVTNVDSVIPDNSMQNGADAVALYLADATDFPDGTAVTAVNLIDALVYDTDDSDDSGLLSVLTPGQAQINERDGGDGEAHSNARTPDGGTLLNTTSYVQQLPTPGQTNSVNWIDLDLTKIVNTATPTLGDNITYTITVANNGPNNASGVTVNDNLPAGLIFVSDDAGTAYDEATGIWNIGNLASSASAILNIVATTNQLGVITNIAEVETQNETGVDSTPGNDDGDQSEGDEDNATITVTAPVDDVVIEPVTTSKTVGSGSFSTTIQVTGQTLLEVTAGEKETDLSTGIQFPLGMVSFKLTSIKGGAIDVTFIFSQDLPDEGFFLYSMDNAGSTTILPDNLWTQQGSRQLRLTTTDGGPFDLDGETNGVITASIAVGTAIKIGLEPFTFSSMENAPFNQWVNSKWVTIKGLTQTTQLSIEGGFISVDEGDYTAGPVGIGLGQRIQVLIKSSDIAKRLTLATVQLGDYKTTFSVITLDNNLNDVIQYGNFCSASSVQNVLKAYITHYNRPPDVGGLNYWSCEMDKQGGRLDAILSFFTNTPEYTAQYVGLSDSKIIDAFYLQLFKRAPDPEGKSFWLNALRNGSTSYEHIAMALINGAIGDDLTRVNNKLSVAEYFVEKLGQNGINTLDFLDIFEKVTEQQDSVDTAKDIIDVFINRHLRLEDTF